MSEEDLRQKKLEELKEAYQRQQEAQQKQLEAEMQANSILKKFVDESGIERLNNVKLVNKELYFSAFRAIMQMVQKGYLRSRLNESQVKEILRQLKPEKEITIKRK